MPMTKLTTKEQIVDLIHTALYRTREISFLADPKDGEFSFEVDGKFWALSPTGLREIPVVDAQYVSVWDDHLKCRSKCRYCPERKIAFDIDTAENGADADNCDALTDEYIILNGVVFREIEFVY